MPLRLPLNLSADLMQAVIMARGSPVCPAAPRQGPQALGEADEDAVGDQAPRVLGEQG